MARPKKEELSEQEELAYHLQSLKRNAGWKYLCWYVEQWKKKTLDEMMVESTFDNMRELRAEFKAYSRLLILPELLIKDLTEGKSLPTFDDFDPYSK